MSATIIDLRPTRGVYACETLVNDHMSRASHFDIAGECTDQLRRTLAEKIAPQIAVEKSRDATQKWLALRAEVVVMSPGQLDEALIAAYQRGIADATEKALAIVKGSD